jgi:hypothetical protein
MGLTEDRNRHRDYVSYLLRMWQDSRDEEQSCPTEATWRATLQSPHTGDLVGFSNLEDLFAFLRGQAGQESAVDNVQNGVQRREH